MVSPENLLPFKSISLYFISRASHASASPRLFRPTKAACIVSLKNCKTMRQLKQIQAPLFRLGLHQDKDALNKAMVFCTDPSLGSLHYAERIFDYVQDPYLFIYNVIIKAYAKKGSFKKVLFLFDQMKDDGLSPDNFTYPFVLKAIGCSRDVLEAGKVHGYIVKSGLEFENYVCNSLIDMYGDLGNLAHAEKLFDEMPERDVVSWNVLIATLVKSRRFQDAIDVFNRFRKESGLNPVEATAVSALSACVALKNMELGIEIHRYINRELEYTVRINNSLVDMYSKCGCLNLAREIFDGMPMKNVICWTSMVSGYVNSGQLDEARVLFDRSPVKDIVLWTAMINGYVQFNQFDEAVGLFREMQGKRVRPDKFTVVALLTGCAQLGALEQGKWIHEYIDDNRIEVDAVVGTALTEMYAKCGCIEKSLEIFRELKRKDTPSWTSVICGLAMNGKTREALDLFSEMNEVGVCPDDITFVGVLSACSHAGLVDEGRHHFNSMQKMFHIKPKLEHYGCIVDLLGRAGLLDEAESLIGNIPNESNEVIVPLYGALLSACRIYGNVEMGERVYDMLLSIEACDASVHTLLANIYASLERWEDVKNVRRKMKALAVKKVPGCSSIEVNGIVHEFVVGDASHPKVTELCFILERLAKLMLGEMEENGMDSALIIS